MKNNISFKIYSFLLFILFMNSMFPWYMWNNYVTQFTIIGTLMMSIYIHYKYPNSFSLSYTKLGLIFITILFSGWTVILHNGYIGRFFSLTIWIFIILLKGKYKIILLNFITKALALLLLCSLISYILFLFGVSITPSTIIWNNGQYIHNNYYTFLLSSKSTDLFRFMGIFMEPGHMAMGVVPLIIANKFNIKNKYVLILLVAELFSFSLAAYITLFFGYFAININKIKYIFWGIASISISILLIDQFDGGKDLLDHFLWRRLEYSDGNISGNNRTTDSFNYIYNNVINSGYKWTGNQSINAEAYEGNSGYKKYIVTDGLIGLILMFILYTYNAFTYRGYLQYIFTIAMLMLLFQNSYGIWDAVFISYIIGCENLKIKQTNAKKTFCASQG